MQWKIYPWIYSQGLKANLDPFLTLHDITINVSFWLFIIFIFTVIVSLWYFYRGILEDFVYHMRWFFWRNWKRARRDLKINDERRYLQTCLNAWPDPQYKKAWEFYHIAKSWDMDDRRVALADAEEDLRIYTKINKVINRKENNKLWFYHFRRYCYQILFGYQGLTRYDNYTQNSFFGEPTPLFYYWFSFFFISIMIICPYLYEYQAPFMREYTFFDVDLMLKRYGLMYDSTIVNFNCYADNETTLTNIRSIVENKTTNDSIK